MKAVTMAGTLSSVHKVKNGRKENKVEEVIERD